MEEENNLAYYNMAKIMSVKSFIVQAPDNFRNRMVNHIKLFWHKFTHALL
jgi:hypothetical protein